MRGLAFSIFFLLAPFLAAAQGLCPSGNLLKSGQLGAHTQVVFPKRATDNVAPKEGDPWRTNLTAVLRKSESFIVWDLGAPTRIDAMLVQGDNNDTYTVSISNDGKTYTPIWTVPMHPSPGMRTRLKSNLAAEGRYLRIGDSKGDGSYSLGEIQAFCGEQSVWPPVLTTKKGKSTSTKNARKTRMARGKLLTGFIGLLVMLTLFGRKRDDAASWFPAALVSGVVLTALGGYQISISKTADRLSTDGGYLLLAGLVALGLAAALRIARDPEKRDAALLGFIAYAGTFLLVHACWRTVAEKQAAWFTSTGVYLVGAVVLGWIITVWMRSTDKSVALLVERGALSMVVVASALTWVNFGTFHGSRAVHFWDSFHYYVGAKYFKENRYDRLYDCSNVADADDGKRKAVLKRKIRDLRNNKLGPIAPIFPRAEAECKAAFTPERWQAFKQDLRLFRSFMGKSWWEKMFRDHGYNATPVWNMVGNLILDRDTQAHLPPPELVKSPANIKGKTKAERAAITARFKTDRDRFEDHIKRFALIDGALYIGIFLLILWGFGLRICALAAIVFAAGFPWAYFWTGGGFGRVPWLFMATAGISLLKRGYPLLAGFALTWTTLLRVFPGALIGGLAVKIVRNLYLSLTGKPVVPGATGLLGGLTYNHRRGILGCILGAAILIPMSLPSADGIEAYTEFLQNSMKHKKTPLTNHMGLPTLLSWHPDLIAKKTKDSKLDDPFLIWKQGRRQTLESRKILHYALLLGLLGLLGYLGRWLEDWAITAASIVMIIGVFELTCYYYNFIILFAPLAIKRARYVAIFIGMAMLGQYIQLKEGWYDVLYQWETLIVLGALLYILIDMAREFRLDEKAQLEPKKAPALTPDPAH